MLVKIAPYWHMVRFDKKGKLAPRYIGSYKIIERIGKVAYRLALLASMGPIHNVFYVLLLCKCLDDLSQVVGLEDRELKDSLAYEKHPIRIMDLQIKILRHRGILLVKV